MNWHDASEDPTDLCELPSGEIAGMVAFLCEEYGPSVEHGIYENGRWIFAVTFLSHAVPIPNIYKWAPMPEPPPYGAKAMKIFVKKTQYFSVVDGVQCQVWVGKTENAIPCELFVAKVTYGSDAHETNFWITPTESFVDVDGCRCRVWVGAEGGRERLYVTEVHISNNVDGGEFFEALDFLGNRSRCSREKGE